MPKYREETSEASQARIRAHQANAAPYPLETLHKARERVSKGNGLPRGWRRSTDGETVYRKCNGWLTVVRTARPQECGPFVFVMTSRQQESGKPGKWAKWEGHRTLEDAMAKADEVMV